MKKFTARANALDGVVRIERLNFSNNEKKLLDRLQTGLEQAHYKLFLEKEEGKPFKVYFALQVAFYKASNSNEITCPPPCFTSEPIVILPSTNVQNIVEKLYPNLIKQIENYQQNGSGWVLKSLVKLDINYLKYNPLRASSFIEMPKKFINKKGFVNVKNVDQKCFLWSVLAALHPVEDHKYRVNNYIKYENELNMHGKILACLKHKMLQFL